MSKMWTEKRIVQVAVSASALLVIVFRKLVPDVELDTTTLILLGIAVLPWIAALVKSIEVPGVGKVELQELKRQVDDASGAAESADKKANLALSPATFRVSQDGAPNPRDAEKKLWQLAEKYNHIRVTQSSGPSRTAAMTTIVREMIDLAPYLEPLEIERLLVKDNLGNRLAAYAFLYARPDYTYLENLVRSVTEIEPKPFAQYWGLQAIMKIIGTREDSMIPTNIAEILKRYKSKVPGRSDRAYEVGRILHQLENSEKD